VLSSAARRGIPRRPDDRAANGSRQMMDTRAGIVWIAAGQLHSYGAGQPATRPFTRRPCTAWLPLPARHTWGLKLCFAAAKRHG
jgi:hypothetical protein